MIRVMIGNEQRFSKNGLPAAVRDLCEQIGFFVADQLAHRFEIAQNLRAGFSPIFGRAFGFMPVTFGKLGRNVACVITEFDNIPLRDAHVFEQFPRRVRRVFEPRVDFADRKFREQFFE